MAGLFDQYFDTTPEPWWKKGYQDAAGGLLQPGTPGVTIETAPPPSPLDVARARMEPSPSPVSEPRTTDYSLGDAFGQAAANLPASGERGFKTLLKSMNPVDAIKLAATAGTEMLKWYLSTPEQKGKTAEKVIDKVADAVPTWQGVKRTIAEDPVMPAATVLAMAGGVGKKPPVVRSTDLPNIRNLSVEEAVAIARQQPHLIKAGDQSAGYYVGGPRDTKSVLDLRRTRRAVDRGIKAGEAGGDWYDRYRASLGETTGNDPVANQWQANLHGQMSAGVDPGSELAGALKETNASIVRAQGVKAMRPAQNEAHIAAINMNDPSLYQLGDKTGEYAKRIMPPREGLLGPSMVGHNQGPPLDDVAVAQVRGPGATGVNDFRWAAEHGFTDPAGASQTQQLTAAQHRYLDYETALAVDRANKAQLGGRNDWTGEQVQAAGWVRQKADAILEQRPALLRDRLDRVEKQAARMGWDKKQIAEAREVARKEADAEAFRLANRQIGDFHDKHTAFGTHEDRPGRDTGHLPGFLTATPDEVAAYHAHPASTWATAPLGRDAIYAGTGIPGTGIRMRVRPTTDMQGMYTPPGGVTEYNAGQTARPLVAFNNAPSGLKSLPDEDRMILQAGETVRAGIDAQNAGAAHKPWLGGPVGMSNSMWVPMNRKLTPDEITKLKAHGDKHGLPDIVDTGQGVTITNFENDPAKMSKKQIEDHVGAIKAILPDAGRIDRSKVDSVYAPLVEAWKKGAGSGAVTDEMLKAMSATPELWKAFNENPYIAERALAKMQRDASPTSMGAPRADVQNLRKIAASGKYWADQLKAARARGEHLPAAALGAGGLLTYGALQEDDRQSY